ncbi:hypothetical protein [Streptomyces avermitilis]|uniref:hypothetical protein n=1 Tax=Streptomyces avermitilis TaxID=33903 RepID=UPI0036A3B30A
MGAEMAGESWVEGAVQGGAVGVDVAAQVESGLVEDRGAAGAVAGRMEGPGEGEASSAGMPLPLAWAMRPGRRGRFNHAFWCTYAKDYTHIKSVFKQTIIDDEKSALSTMLAACTN